MLLPLGTEPDPGNERKTRPRLIVLRMPTEGQILVLSRLPRMIEDSRVLEALMTFGDVLERLIVQDEDREYAYKGLANETIQTSEYLDLLVKLVEHVGKPAEQAPTTGPAARKRPAPRARR